MESKSKILYLYKLLNETTDEQHPISTTEIIDKLKAEGISVTRKTVASDIALLCEFGVDVITVRSSQNLYYVGSRQFELPEIKLLIDAVESSKLITQKKSKVLISKLSTLLSDKQASELERHVFIDERIKPENEEVYYSIDKIHTAIMKSAQIKFKYIDYNQEKEIEYRHKGQTYHLSPYALVWNEDHYYVVGYCSNHEQVSTFRVDRMAKVQAVNEDAIAAPEDFSASEYAKSVFDMYDGEKQVVELKCTNELMKVIIDKFGEDIETQTLGSHCFKVIVPVAVSPTFFGWIFQFAGKMSILAPSSVKNDYAEMVRKSL